MIKKLPMLFSALVLTSSIVSARTYISNDGRSISAKFVSSIGDNVTLKLSKNGRNYTLPLSRLSKADQEYIKDKREVENAKNEAALAKQAKLVSVEQAIKQIVDYVKSQKGKKVGDGECWTLANEAFKSANIQRKGPRVWGRIVDWKHEAVLPGDILELESATFIVGSTTTTTGPNHTAVIMKKSRTGKISVYNQNVNGKKIVIEGEYQLKKLKKGKVIVYRYE